MKTLTLMFTLILAISAGAQNKYTTFEVGPGAGLNFDNVSTINDSGQVLGWWPQNGEAYVLNPGGVRIKNIIKTCGACGPLAMNNAATIVGMVPPFYKPEGFYKPWGQSWEGITGEPLAINTTGTIAGTTLAYGPTQLYLEDPNVSFVHVPFPHDKWPDNFVHINTLGLNNLNQVVGSWDNDSTPWSGFFYDSKSHQLNTTFNMPGAVNTYPVSINDKQEVVGDWVDGNNVEHGFYWSSAAGFSDIDVVGDTLMYLVGINNQSVILGGWRDANSPPKLHYVTIVNGQPTASIKVPGSVSMAAIAINNVGQVVGEYETQAGIVRGFIYTIY